MLKTWKTLFLALLATTYLVGCAGDDQQIQEGLENYEYENGEMGNYETTGDNFAAGNYENGGEEGGNEYSEGGDNYGNNYDYGNEGEGNNYGDENLAANNSGGNNYGNYNYGNSANAEGEQVNNALDDELFANETLTNDGLTGQALNNYSSDSEVDADAALVNTSGYENNLGMAPAADQSANALPEYGASASGPSTPPPAGGIVKYVLNDVSMLDQPNGSPVKSLSRGDHPVVYDMGEYHQTMEGYVIPSTAITTEPTGRLRTPGYWR